MIFGEVPEQKRLARGNVEAPMSRIATTFKNFECTLKSGEQCFKIRGAVTDDHLALIRNLSHTKALVHNPYDLENEDTKIKKRTLLAVAQQAAPIMSRVGRHRGEDLKHHVPNWILSHS